MLISLKKVTIITESLLKESILDILREAGSTGHTLTACEGEGSKGIHASDFEGRNIQIDTIVPLIVGEKILTEVSERYMKNYALIAYMTDVEVVREDKFVRDYSGD
ncbi:MAG: P-II family nitrogen regulator [Akkermansiaceae bacterium]